MLHCCCDRRWLSLCLFCCSISEWGYQLRCIKSNETFQHGAVPVFVDVGSQSLNDSNNRMNVKEQQARPEQVCDVIRSFGSARLIGILCYKNSLSGMKPGGMKIIDIRITRRSVHLPRLQMSITSILCQITELRSPDYQMASHNITVIMLIRDPAHLMVMSVRNFRIATFQACSSSKCPTPTLRP